MLFSYNRHGTSRRIVRCYFHNSVLHTRTATTSSQSVLKSERRDGWPAIPNDEGHKANVALFKEQILVEGDGSKLSSEVNGDGVQPARLPTLRSVSRREQEDKAIAGGVSPQSNGKNTILGAYRAQDHNGSHDKLMTPIEFGRTSPASIVQAISSSHHGVEASASPKDLSLRENAPGENKANSLFLDHLQNDQVKRETIKNELNVPVPEKMSQLRKIMATRDPQALLMYMDQAADDLEFMHAIPGVTFIELLRQLHPRNEFSPLRAEYKGQGPKHYHMLSGWRIRFYDALLDRRRLYQDIALKRIASGRKLGVGEYTQLLNLARATWDGLTALEIVKNMLAEEVMPDLSCYNHYFEARCWSDAYHPDESQRLRVTPHNMEMRKSLSKRLVSDEVMIDGHKVEENGLRWEITRMFTKMVQEGIRPDTRAYCNLITAQSREGDLRAIKSVLSRVWDVDIDRLLLGAPDSDENKLPKDSPTYPTKDLLFTLAHVFGSNSDVPAAIRIVDHFSRKYSIRIPQPVWAELMQWTFVLSARRRKTRRLDGSSVGQLPLKSVESLWDVMQGAPYHSQPTLLMYDYVIRSRWRRDRRSLYPYLRYMRKGIKLHDQDCAAYEAAIRELRGSHNSKKKSTISSQEGEQQLEKLDPLPPQILVSRMIRLEELRGQRFFSAVLARKWFLLLLCNQRWLKEPWEREVKWSRKLLPDAVLEFWRFKSHQPISYPMLGGRVELDDPIYEQQWAADKAAREETEIGLDSSLVMGRGFRRIELDDEPHEGKEQDLAEEEREILEEDEWEAEEQSAEDRAEEIRRDLDDL